MLYTAEHICYLVMVTPDNHNKYYRMVPNVPSAGNFTAEYGRVGASSMKHVYPMSEFNKIYDSKIRKGYSDQSDLHECVVSTITDNKYGAIEDVTVQLLVDQLMSYQDKKLKASYTISHKDVTPKMIRKARQCIALLSDASVSAFNTGLIELFSALPRRMDKVENYLANSKADFSEIVERESDLLDIMAAKVSNMEKNMLPDVPKNTSGKSTILEALGLEIRPCTDSEAAMIQEHLDPDTRSKFDKTFYIKNIETEKRYNKYMKEHGIKKSRFFYHGSRNENWWGIATQGLKLNPTAVTNGKMFGYGLYFAPLAKKSCGYVSLSGSGWAHGTDNTGFLAVYKVAYKNPLDAYSYENRFGKFDKKDIASLGKDSLFAHKGTMLYNDELIIYNESQCTIRYLIQLKK